jgi:hypothetical protein
MFLWSLRVWDLEFHPTSRVLPYFTLTEKMCPLPSLTSSVNT